MLTSGGGGSSGDKEGLCGLGMQGVVYIQKEVYVHF